MRLLVAALLLLPPLARDAMAQPRPGAAPPPARQPAATGSVVGVVEDAAGAPIEGAQVRVGDREAMTGPPGSFRITGLPAGTHPVVIRRVGYTPVRSRVVVSDSGPTEVEYVMTSAAVLLPTTVVEGSRAGIYGVVGDTAYRAIEGARVQLLGPQTFDVRSDSAGRFSFPATSPGSYVVRVTHDGYSERRVHTALERGAGREMSVLLSPGASQPTTRENIAALDLGRRLRMGVPRERLDGAELARLAGGGCTLATRVLAEVGRNDISIVVNGVYLRRESSVQDLCLWRPEELDLVEFGRDVCAEVTHSVADVIGVGCTGFRTRVSRSIDPRGTSGRRPGPQAYVVLWEKR